MTTKTIKVSRDLSNTICNGINQSLQLPDKGDAEDMVRYLAFNIGLSLYRQDGGCWDEERILSVITEELKKGVEDEESVQTTGDPSEHEKRFEIVS